MKIRRVFALPLYKLSLWESVLLAFCPLLRQETEISVMYYKVFWNRMYIYSLKRIITPQVAVDFFKNN